LVQTGDLDAYRKLCERVLLQFGDTTEPAIAERMAKDCLMLPPLAANLAVLDRMANTAVRADPNDNLWPYFAFVKGLAEYRQGRYASALEWLRKAAAHEGVPARTAQTDAVMAMAEFQSGQTKTARALLTDGIRIAETKLSRPDRLDWSDGIIAQILLHEASRLIAQPPSSAPGK
jgi:tetratricopeptide (TPR) repeat protein